MYRQERHVYAAVTNNHLSLSGLNDRGLVLICPRRSQANRGSLLRDHSGMEADRAVTISDDAGRQRALEVSR